MPSQKCPWLAEGWDAWSSRALTCSNRRLIPVEAEAGPELGSQALPAQPPVCSAVVIAVVTPWDSPWCGYGLRELCTLGNFI